MPNLMRYLKNAFHSAVLMSLLSLPFAGKAQASYDTAAWNAWKQEIKAEVIKKGISPSSAESMVESLEFDPAVLKQDNNQPVKTSTFPEYRAKAVSQGRIDRGRAFYAAHRAEIDQFADRYGVEPSVIVAILGIETDYGGYTGNFDVLSSVATLAFGATREDPQKQADRRKYFRAQVYHAMKILEEGLVPREKFKGSWAGAFGINQHMPESFFNYVVDGDGDGDKDIMSMDDLSDVFATTASHLQKVGWKDGYKWGREVIAPASIPKSLIENKTKKPLSEWAAMGVTLPDGSPLPVANMQAALVIPRGGQAFLAYDNFFAFRRWNASDYFALTVGLLSDAIAQP